MHDKLNTRLIFNIQIGLTKENTTVTLYGESNDPWTFAELWRNESLLCRSKGMQDEECSTDVNYAVSRLNNIQVVPSGYERNIHGQKYPKLHYFYLETVELSNFGFPGSNRMTLETGGSR